MLDHACPWDIKIKPQNLGRSEFGGCTKVWPPNTYFQGKPIVARAERLHIISRAITRESIISRLLWLASHWDTWADPDSVDIRVQHTYNPLVPAKLINSLRTIIYIPLFSYKSTISGVTIVVLILKLT